MVLLKVSIQINGGIMKRKLLILSTALLGFSFLLKADLIDNGLEKVGLKRMTTFDRMVQQAGQFKDSVVDLCNQALNSQDFIKGAQATGALGLGIVGAACTIKALIPFFDKEKKWKDVIYPGIVAIGAFWGAYRLGSNCL